MRTELGLYSLNLSDQVQVMTNPFTSEKIKVPIDEGFSSEKQKKLKELLEKRGWDKVDEDGYRRCVLKSGCDVWVRDYGFPTVPRLPSIAIEIDIEDIYIAEFLFELMKESEAVLGCGINNFISVTKELPQRAIERWETVEFADDPKSLLGWLSRQG